MRLDTSLEDLKRACSLCLRCLVCTYGKWPKNYPLCPVYQKHRVYTASPGGFVYFVRALAEGNASCTPLIADFAYQCTLCKACDVCEIVPIPAPHASPTDIIRFLRYQLVKNDVIPQSVKEIVLNFKTIKPYTESSFRVAYAPLTPDAADTVLLVDTFISKYNRELYEGSLKLLQKLGKKVMIVESDVWTWAHILYDFGFWDELKVFLKTLVEYIEQLFHKELVFLNPHVYEFMVKTYPQLVPLGPQIKGKHLIELIAYALNKGQLKVKKEKIKVSYHDPCHLSRGLGIREEPREVLAMLGLNLIEMKRNGDNTYCCGTNEQAVGSAFVDFSRWIAEERLKEFRETGAELLITACPYCKEAFLRVLPPEERERVKDLIELVSRQSE